MSSVITALLSSLGRYFKGSNLMAWTNATKTSRATIDALKCGDIVLEAIMLIWLFGHATLMAVYKSKKRTHSFRGRTTLRRSRGGWTTESARALVAAVAGLIRLVGTLVETTRFHVLIVSLYSGCTSQEDTRAHSRLYFFSYPFHSTTPFLSYDQSLVTWSFPSEYQNHHLL